MDYDQFPLSMFEVDCDGSACGSGRCVLHVHPPQSSNLFSGPRAITRVVVRNNERIHYEDAHGITRLMLAS